MNLGSVCLDQLATSWAYFCYWTEVHHVREKNQVCLGGSLTVNVGTLFFYNRGNMAIWHNLKPVIPPNSMALLTVTGTRHTRRSPVVM